jgi:hypothetical protein
MGGRPDCTASDAVDHLLDQLNVGREEHAAMAAKMQAKFAAEVAALRAELAESHAMMERMRTLLAFSRYERRESDSVN